MNLEEEINACQQSELVEEKVKRNEYMKLYYQRTYVKAKVKEYNERPDIKAKRNEYLKEYNERPYVKAKRKMYNERPYVKAKMKEYNIEYYRKNKKVSSN